jgi:carbon-monoxide dehydrogenase medium subunit
MRDALKFMESRGEGAAVLAGGTDLLPRIRRRQTIPMALLNIASLQDELRYIREDDGVVRVGALTTVSDLLESDTFGGRLSVVHEAAAMFGAPQIQNVATVGGNVCSATSSEDLIPVFLALDARVKLCSSAAERSLPLRDFVKGKRATAMKPSEILSEVYFGALDGHSWSAFEKLGRRRTLIISLVNESLVLSLEDDLETVGSARIALNRVTGRIPARAEKTERFLTGRKLSDRTTTDAQRMLAAELNLKGDFRGSGAYRAEVATVYLKRLIRRCVAGISGA